MKIRYLLAAGLIGASFVLGGCGADLEELSSLLQAAGESEDIEEEPEEEKEEEEEEEQEDDKEDEEEDEKEQDDKESDSEELFSQFIDEKIPAIWESEDTDDVSEVMFSDFVTGSGEWDDCYVIDERVDLDNDGEGELMLGGPYGGIYFDARDGKVYVLASGDGTALVLGYAEYEGQCYITHQDTTHGGRLIYFFDRYNGKGEIEESFTLSAEYFDNEYDHYSKDSNFTFKDEPITMEEFEDLRKEIFGSPTKVEYGKDLGTNFRDYIFDESAEQIVNDGSDEFWDALSAFEGSFTYVGAQDGLDGTLAINRIDIDEFDIDDNNTNGYRFLAFGSNVSFIQDDTLFLEYPENVSASGTADITYYVIARRDYGLIVYTADKDFKNWEYLYTAWIKY